MLRRYRIQLISSLLGTLAGGLILHPYTMFIYAVMHYHEGGLHLHWGELSAQAVAAFGPMMLPMTIPFVLLGATIGLLIGILIDRRAKLSAAEYESRKGKIALRTLMEVMVTLSHYLLNANMIIGGKVRHCRKITSDEDISAALDIIEEQGRKIDAVIHALRNVTEIKTASYASDGRIQMIDISKEIEEELRRTEGPDLN